MVAVAAAGIAAAATVASTAVTATSGGGGKGGGGAPQMQGMTPWERIFNRGTADILDEERRVMEDAISQASWMQPELYALLGYEPIYDERITADQLGQLGQAVDTLQTLQTEGKIAVEESTQQIKLLRQEKRRLKGKKNKKRRKEIQQQIIELKQTKRAAKQADGPLQKEAAAAQKLFGDAQTLPRRIIGFKKLAKPADPTGSGGLFQQALDLENQTLINALQGKEPVDATLRTAWEEKERTLRERLRRQMGSDYETSTPGSQALANFDRERNEAFAEWNQQTIQRYHGLTGQRTAELSDLTSARMQQLLYPSRSQQATALQLGQVAGDRLGIAAHFQNERTAQFKGKSDAYAIDSAEAAARAQAIGDLIGATGAGVGAGLNTYLGSQTTTTTTPDTTTTLV